MARDPYRNRGAREQDKREQPTNLDFYGQLGHRNKGPLIDSHDTDFPEPGENPEHSGEAVMKPKTNLKTNPKKRPEKGKGKTRQDVGKVEIEIEETKSEEVDQDPGERQKENQNQQKDDPLAA